MTDRVKAIVVVLEENQRIDDCEKGLMLAIKHMKGVVDVKPVIADILQDSVIRARTLSEVKKNLLKFWDTLST